MMFFFAKIFFQPELDNEMVIYVNVGLDEGLQWKWTVDKSS